MTSEEWKVATIRDVVACLDAGASVLSEDRTKRQGEIGVLKVSAVSYGRFIPEAHKAVVEASQIARLAVIPQQDTLLVSRANTFDLVGASVYVTEDYPDLFLSDKLWRIRTANNCDARWLSYVLSTGRVRANISERATGTSGSMKNISQEAFFDVKIPLPPLPEQRKIAEILGTWDAAIERVTRLIAALQRRKQGLMQRLLVPHKADGQPEVRLPGFAASWRIARFDEVFARVTRKNSVGNKTVLTASGQHGLISQTDYFNRNVASESLDGYYLLHRGEFAYNRSSMNGYPYGAIKQLEAYEAGVLSTLYLCFGLFAEACTPRFYKHFFEAGGMNRGIYSIAQEGARNHGLLNVGVSEFFGLSVPVPSLDEQQRLADLFDVVEQEIDKTIAYRAALRQQKQGLMQRLLTGQVRVPVATTANAHASGANQAG